ncbi:SPW repeat domain-containing protein [Myxosarcina sp. GI1(2024)]
MWLIIAPFLLGYVTSASRGNDIAIGIIIAILAALRLFGAYRAAWLSWLNALSMAANNCSFCTAVRCF